MRIRVFTKMGGNVGHLVIVVLGLFALLIHPVLAALYVIAGILWIGLDAYDEWDSENW